MFWLILWIALLSIGIGSIICIKLEHGEEGVAILAAVAMFFGVLGLAILPFCSMANEQYVSTWNQVKETYENLSTNELDNISIGLEIAEKNEELFKYQFFTKTYGFFTTMPKEVLDLEPIKTIQ